MLLLLLLLLSFVVVKGYFLNYIYVVNETCSCLIVCICRTQGRARTQSATTTTIFPAHQDAHLGQGIRGNLTTAAAARQAMRGGT